MLRFELNKLFFKQKAIALLVVVLVIEALTVIFIYPENTFTTREAERQFYEYAEELSGKLTAEKKEIILAEQLAIIEAKNNEGAVAAKLRNGSYENRDEYRAELAKTQEITMRSEPFNELFTRYSHALADPEKRYVLKGNYDGMTVDFADFPFILLIVFSTAMLFLGEENSNMITFLRISENGRHKTFFAKIVSIALLIIAGSVFRMAAEFVMLNIRGSFEELFYPIQSIVYFDGCPFKLTILDGFFALNLIKLLGYFFVSAFVVLLSITLKKALLTVFIPFALCVIQQFSFVPETPAYYLPTGMLRAVGYFRGEYQTVTIPIEIIEPVPPQILFIVTGFSAVFVIAAIITAYNYYNPRKALFKTNTAISALCVLLICVMLSGCSEERTGSYMNLRDSGAFAQSDEYIFLSDDDGIRAIRKSDGENLALVHNPFEEKSVMSSSVYANGNTLYYLTEKDLFSELRSISADTFEKRLVYSPTADEGRVIGLDYGFERKGILADAVFTNGNDWFFISSGDGGVFRLKNGSFENVLADKEYKHQLSFDGRHIFYITQSLELMCLDTVSGEKKLICGDFVRAVCTDGTHVVYSTERGIFLLDPESSSTEKISDETADGLAYADGRTVYSKDGTLYLLGVEPVELYSGVEFGFAVISGTDTVWVRAYDAQTDSTDDLFLEFSAE